MSYQPFADGWGCQATHRSPSINKQVTISGYIGSVCLEYKPFFLWQPIRYILQQLMVFSHSLWGTKLMNHWNVVFIVYTVFSVSNSDRWWLRKWSCICYFKWKKKENIGNIVCIFTEEYLDRTGPNFIMSTSYTVMMSSTFYNLETGN